MQAQRRTAAGLLINGRPHPDLNQCYHLFFLLSTVQRSIVNYQNQMVNFFIFLRQQQALVHPPKQKKEQPENGAVQSVFIIVIAQSDPSTFFRKMSAGPYVQAKRHARSRLQDFFIFLFLRSPYRLSKRSASCSSGVCRKTCFSPTDPFRCAFFRERLRADPLR